MTFFVFKVINKIINKKAHFKNNNQKSKKKKEKMDEKRIKEEATKEVAAEKVVVKEVKAAEVLSENGSNLSSVQLESKRKFTDAQFERMIAETLRKHPLDSNYAARCYCRRCNTSWEMTKKGVKVLKDQSSTGEIKIPEGMAEQDLEDLSKLFFIIEPCFVCQEREEKIRSEARLKTSVSLFNNKRRTKF